MNMLTDSHPFEGWPKWDDATILEQAVKRLDLFNDGLARQDDVLDGAPLDYAKFKATYQWAKLERAPRLRPPLPTAPAVR